MTGGRVRPCNVPVLASLRAAVTTKHCRCEVVGDGAHLRKCWPRCGTYKQYWGAGLGIEPGATRVPCGILRIFKPPVALPQTQISSGIQWKGGNPRWQRGKAHYASDRTPEPLRVAELAPSKYSRSADRVPMARWRGPMTVHRLISTNSAWLAHHWVRWRFARCQEARGVCGLQVVGTGWNAPSSTVPSGASGLADTTDVCPTRSLLVCCGAGVLVRGASLQLVLWASRHIGPPWPNHTA